MLTMYKQGSTIILRGLRSFGEAEKKARVKDYKTLKKNLLYNCPFFLILTYFVVSAWHLEDKIPFFLQILAYLGIAAIAIMVFHQKENLLARRSWFVLDPARESMTWYRKFGFKKETRLITDIQHFGINERETNATSGNYVYKYITYEIYAVDVTGKHILILENEDKDAIAKIGTEFKNMTGKEFVPVNIIYVSKDNISWDI